MKTQRSLTFEENIWGQIDELRGDIPRSRFVEKLVIGGLEEIDQ